MADLVGIKIQDIVQPQIIILCIKLGFFKAKYNQLKTKRYGSNISKGKKVRGEKLSRRFQHQTF